MKIQTPHQLRDYSYLKRINSFSYLNCLSKAKGNVYSKSHASLSILLSIVLCINISLQLSSLFLISQFLSNFFSLILIRLLKFGFVFLTFCVVFWALVARMQTFFLIMIYISLSFYLSAYLFSIFKAKRLLIAFSLLFRFSAFYLCIRPDTIYSCR